MSLNVQYLFVHTAAADIRNVDRDVIDRWHRDRGWAGIGYHYVILDDRHDRKADGTIEVGRPETRSGAHVLHLNSVSIGICCAGHGDRRPLTAAQMRSLVGLLADLCQKYKLAPDRILGHREVNRLADMGLAPPEARTSKSCPGTRVDCDAIRAAVQTELAQRAGAPVQAEPSPEALEALRQAIAIIQKHEALLGNARDEWRSFLGSGEVHGILGR